MKKLLSLVAILAAFSILLLQNHAKADCPCPQEGSDWLSFEVEKNSQSCADDKCKIRPVLNIPDNVRNCYEWYKFEVSRQGFTTPEVSTRQIDEKMPCYCVYEGDLVSVKMSLYKRGNGDTCNPDCVFEASSRACGIPEPCTPDAPNVPWVIDSRELIVKLDEICPGCNVEVIFAYRKPDPAKGFPYQDLQILRIRFDENSPCANCDIDKIYEYAVAGVIQYSDVLIGFRPFVNECFDQWRVANAGCWSQKMIGFGPNGPIIEWAPCISAYFLNRTPCCVQQLRVCRLDDQGTVEITPIGNVQYSNFACLVSFDEFEQCIRACEWAGKVNGVYQPVNIFGKQSTRAVNKDKFVNSITSHFINNTLSFELNSKQEGTAVLNVYDLVGTRIATREYGLSKGLNTFSYTTSHYSSGTYNYTITIDNAVILNDQFVVVK